MRGTVLKSILHREAQRGPDALDKHMQGDELEFAARVATEQASCREPLPGESDVFRLGYATAALELAVVLRAMRRKEMPSEAEMAEARRTALAMSGVEPQEGEIERVSDWAASTKLKRFVVVYADGYDETKDAEHREFDTEHSAKQWLRKERPSSGHAAQLIIDLETRTLVEERYT